ncbi:arginase family protein [Limnoglobus roseus]|uniref:Arginase-family protein n=1 Tax=Limnoglobus roseus TaxID=2598579 RepID=A0A5C1A5R1_9BACT|nr:arginase family protein [Limnoglobus roseus]QEL13685.1 arginase-family protein [Limnoglobus roseus]
MRTTAVVFPFDTFGNSGTGAGAELLGDVLREVLADTDAEKRATRPAVLRDKLKVKDFAFETMADVTAWRETGRQAAKKVLAAGDFLLWLGGNHLSVLPVYEELPPDTLVIQFDAHLDIYNLHDCTPELSHGNFLLHAERPLPRVVNVGSRDQFLMPRYVGRTFAEVFPAERIAADFAGVLQSLTEQAATASNIWIDLDVDAVDPLFLPAVCQPMPFGMTPQQLLAVLQAVWGDKVLGVSISEFAPGHDVRDAGLNLLGWLLEWLLLKRYGV